MSVILENICKSFGEKVVLDNFSLKADDGDRICLFGPSGGGKTTLLNIIAGLLKPDSGNLQCSHKNISYVFQEYRLLPWATAIENITIATGCPVSKAKELLSAIELSADMNNYPDNLSGGMKQRVNIARALAYNSDLILMDEPFKELDAELKEKIIAVTDEYCRDRTVILVTHEMRDAELLGCTKIYKFN